jgi:hypothetical protein
MIEIEIGGQKIRINLDSNEEVMNLITLIEKSF